ncbi:response regulator [Yeosuana sp. AK3]
MKRLKFEYRITIIYFIIGGFWILFSDWFLNSIIQDNNILTEIQTYKGWFYVFVTGILFFIYIKRHLKQLRLTQKALKTAKEKAEESDRLKTAFLQNMSHEIRTPMNAIMGFSSLLPDTFDDKTKLQKYSEIIKQRSHDLLDIINDILDISKIESGQLSVNQDVCDLKALFAELQTFFVEYQNRMGKQHIKFSLHAFNDNEQHLIYTDKVKLKQIFINLISNAFKFTNAGSIMGGCKLDEHKKAVFYVSDTGIGIPFDKQQIIYERFSQLQQNSEVNAGTGLGLSIAKGLVGILGGELLLESEPGKGSTFFFSFPFKTVQPLEENPSTSKLSKFHNLTNKTILIVEDDVSNAEYLKEILTECGVTVVHTTLGKKAIKISLTQPLDLVLMDIRLPDLNGYETTLKIKQLNPQIKIIAQTAYAMEDETQKAMDAGCMDYISKPIHKDHLLTLISKHLSKK